MSDTEQNAGESGGIKPWTAAEASFLTASELQVLERRIDRFPMDSAERREAVETVFKSIRGSKSHRTRLRAVAVLGMLDKINLQAELKDRPPPHMPGDVNVNVQVNNNPVVELTDDTLLARLVRIATIQETNGHVKPPTAAQLSSNGPVCAEEVEEK